MWRASACPPRTGWSTCAPNRTSTGCSSYWPPSLPFCPGTVQRFNQLTDWLIDCLYYNLNIPCYRPCLFKLSQFHDTHLQGDAVAGRDYAHDTDGATEHESRWGSDGGGLVTLHFRLVDSQVQDARSVRCVGSVRVFARASVANSNIYTRGNEWIIILPLTSIYIVELLIFAVINRIINSFNLNHSFIQSQFSSAFCVFFYDNFWRNFNYVSPFCT